MSEILSEEERQELEFWRKNIESANRNNIFCHCRRCGAEWVDSSLNAVCSCGNSQVERISCWQFPDD